MHVVRGKRSASFHKRLFCARFLFSASRIYIIMGSCFTAEGSSMTLLEPFPPLSRERNTSCPSLAGSSQTGPILILIFLALLMEGCWGEYPGRGREGRIFSHLRPGDSLCEMQLLGPIKGRRENSTEDLKICLAASSNKETKGIPV